MPITHSSDSVDIRAVVAANVYMRGWKDLEIPVGWFVVLLEAIAGQEVERWTFVACGHDAYITFDKLFAARSAFGCALASVIKLDTVLLKVLDVASQPAGFTRTNLLQYIVVHHWSFREESLSAILRRCYVLEVTVEKETQKPFWDEREDGLLAEDVQS